MCSRKGAILDSWSRLAGFKTGLTVLGKGQWLLDIRVKAGRGRGRVG